jgi:hypothetical protein
METYFLPPERASDDSIQSDFETFSSFGQVNEIVNALPYIVSVLNKERQLVYCNAELIKMTGVKGLQDILSSL